LVLVGGSDGFEDVLTDLRREYCECVIFYLEPYDDRFEVGDPLAMQAVVGGESVRYTRIGGADVTE
jgi:hypothetical protein